MEAPCQARNAAGASNALVSAELVLAGVPEVIPFDEVVEAARQVGHALPESLRETALGGIAATPDCRGWRSRPAAAAAAGAAEYIPSFNKSVHAFRR